MINEFLIYILCSVFVGAIIVGGARFFLNRYISDKDNIDLNQNIKLEKLDKSITIFEVDLLMLKKSHESLISEMAAMNSNISKEVHSLSLAITKIDGSINAINETIKGMRDFHERIVDKLLTNDRG